MALILSTAAAGAQTSLLPHGNFESGDQVPTSWTFEGAAGDWTTNAFAGRRAIEVRGQGHDQGYWRTAALPLASGRLYALRFRGTSRMGSHGGTAVVGTSRVSRDFRLEPTWQEHSFLFRVTDDPAPEFVRFGQWHVRGAVAFDEASLHPVRAVHRWMADGSPLGEGESVRRGVYRFEPQFGWRGGVYHRPLWWHRGSFNTDRLLFAPGAELVYRFAVGQARQQSARLRVGINHYVAGQLQLEAGHDGVTWQAVATLDGDRRAVGIDLPSALFPATAIFVRLRLLGEGNLQVNTCDYVASLVNPPGDAEGETHFVEVETELAPLDLRVEAVRYLDDRGAWEAVLHLTNAGATSLRLSAWLSRGEPAAGPPAARGGRPVRVAPGQAARLVLSTPAGEPGPDTLRLTVRDQVGALCFAGNVAVRLGLLSDQRAGYWLAEQRGLAAWWCESGWKIGRDRGMPARPRGKAPHPIHVAAARGEFEAVQVVLRPARAAQLEAVRLSTATSRGGQRVEFPLRLDEVAYVPVTQPTDGSAVRDWYPDPLPPLRTPLALGEGVNQPLWLTFQVPRGTAAGDYAAELEVQTTVGRLRLPVRVRVYDFDLPCETHLRSALGLGSGAIRRYHRLAEAKDQAAVFEKYLENFAEHRISPYSFYDHAPIEVRFEGAGTNQQAVVDFAQFDVAAARWLDAGRFNTFQLPLRGMGGGTFHSRHLGELAGFTEGTPEHARLFADYLGQVERHLRERGWLDKAFTYWFDEPDPKDYDFVVEGMKRLKAAAPGIRRMLTEQPEPELLGHVDIWCALTPEWTREQVQARRAAGEEVWWYICTAPKAPYVTEFIDHPGTELRLWPWQSWQYGVSGILIWATVYWTSPLGYPEPTLQDPWQDPMSWVSGYGFPVGHRSPWGNGDGRFLYPPRRDPNLATAPCLDAPINSLRWENLRDGMEDYEYLWLLDQTVREAAARGVMDADGMARARQLLEVPPAISQDLTHFTTDPRPILRHREQVAQLIETLRRSRR